MQKENVSERDTKNRIFSFRRVKEISSIYGNISMESKIFNVFKFKKKKKKLRCRFDDDDILRIRINLRTSKFHYCFFSSLMTNFQIPNLYLSINDTPNHNFQNILLFIHFNKTRKEGDTPVISMILDYIMIKREALEPFLLIITSFYIFKKKYLI